MCEISHKERRLIMATNLAIDDELLNNALKAGGLKTKKDTVNLALKEFIQRRKTADIIDLFGKIAYAPDHDHKKARRSGR
jgi:Arc/MetJ family transcription regulator